MKNGNGSNGNGHGKPTTKSTAADAVSKLKLDAQGRVVIDDLVPASVLVMFFVQKLGKSSARQIAAKVEASNVVMDEHLMQNAIDALQARQFLSYAKGKAAGGEVVDMWKPRKANFGGMPDVAQVDQSFLSSLVSTPDAEELLGSLNEAEEEGDGTAKAKEKLKYADFYAAEITFRVKDMLLGGRPSSPYFDKVLLPKGPKHPLEAKLRFPRDNDGWPIIPTSNIRGWLGSGFRMNNMSEATAQYIGITGGRIEFDGKIEQYAQPVVDLSGASRGAGGLGITSYECIAGGAKFKFRFMMPKRGFLTYTQFVGWLMKYAANSPRGLSNARSNEWGFVEILNAEYLGETRTAKEAIEPLLDGMSTEARKFAEAFLAKLGDKDLDLFSGKDQRAE